MIFTRANAYTSAEQVEKLTRTLNIHYRFFIGSLIYFLYKRVDLSFSVIKLAKFSSNPDKVHFEGLVHIFGYIRDNKTFGLKYYDDMNDAPVSELLRQAIINTENQYMALSDSSCKYCTNTGRSTGSYIIFYQCGPIDYGTHDLGPVSKSSAEK